MKHTFKIDLHTHTSDFAHFIGIKNHKESYVRKLLELLFKKHTFLILGIANFDNDRRYEKFVGTLKKMKKEYQCDFTYESYFVRVSRANREIYLVKTDEIATNKGHVLVIGYMGKITGKKLDNVIAKAHREHCLIIANHPLHIFGIGHFLVKKIFGDHFPTSMGKRDEEKYASQLDGLEWNSYFPEDRSIVKKAAQKKKLILTASSDAHFLDEFFSSYIELEGVDFTNPEIFKRSLKKAFKHHVKLHPGNNGFVAVYRHGLQVIIEKFGLMLGILKK